MTIYQYHSYFPFLRMYYLSYYMRLRSRSFFEGRPLFFFINLLFSSDDCFFFQFEFFFSGFSLDLNFDYLERLLDCFTFLLFIQANFFSLPRMIYLFQKYFCDPFFQLKKNSKKKMRTKMMKTIFISVNTQLLQELIIHPFQSFYPPYNFYQFCSYHLLFSYDLFLIMIYFYFLNLSFFLALSYRAFIFFHYFSLSFLPWPIFMLSSKLLIKLLKGDLFDRSRCDFPLIWPRYYSKLYLQTPQ